MIKIKKERMGDLDLYFDGSKKNSDLDRVDKQSRSKHATRVQNPSTSDAMVIELDLEDLEEELEQDSKKEKHVAMVSDDDDENDVDVCLDLELDFDAEDCEIDPRNEEEEPTHLQTVVPCALRGEKDGVSNNSQETTTKIDRMESTVVRIVDEKNNNVVVVENENMTMTTTTTTAETAQLIENKQQPPPTELEQLLDEETILKKLGQPCLIFSLQNHYKNVLEVVPELKNLGSDAPYNKMNTTILSMLHKNLIEKSEKRNGEDNVNPIELAWSKPNDALYILDELSTDETIRIKDLNNIEQRMIDIPLEYRSHLESYQEPPDPNKGETPCVNDCKCQGLRIPNVDRSKRFVLKKFYLKHEIEKARENKSLLNPNRSCLFCILYEQTKAFIYFSVKGNRSSKVDSSFQMFRVSEGKRGQFFPNDCLWFPMKPENNYYGLLGSIPLFRLNGYTYEVKNGRPRYVSTAPVPTKKCEEKLSKWMGFRTTPFIVKATTN